MTPRTIAIVTGSRADFGILVPVMRAVQAHSRLRLQTIVTGTHLSARTWRDVAVLFRIDAKVGMQRAGVTGRAADVAALGHGVIGLGAALERLHPDVVLVPGDRIEALAAACAASVGGFRLGHLHGGDRAEGVADEAMRHAVSKLAHLHFAASRQSRQRLIRMGEPPEWVFNVGSPAIDGLADIPAVPGQDELLEHEYGLAPDQPVLIVMQHPVGASPEQERAWMAATLAATTLRDLRDTPRVIMHPNADPGREGIFQAIQEHHRLTDRIIQHLPRPLWLALLRRATALVGNSSAGLIEAAAVRPGGVPVVNIGPRQAGRERPANVIDCAYGKTAVRTALATALRRPPRRLKHPYGAGDAGRDIADLLARLDLAQFPLRKRNSY